MQIRGDVKRPFEGVRRLPVPFSMPGVKTLDTVPHDAHESRDNRTCILRHSGGGDSLERSLETRACPAKHGANEKSRPLRSNCSRASGEVLRLGKRRTAGAW